jgi:hypothetical protein
MIKDVFLSSFEHLQHYVGNCKAAKTLMAATPTAKQPKRLDTDPFGVLTIKIPPRMTTPERMLLVLINGMNNAGSTLICSQGRVVY